MAPKSRARRSAVAFPIPELAPVTIATDFDMVFPYGFEVEGARARCLSLN
jgi:hypothetical protein